MKPTGYVLWRGASLLDGASIVVVAVGIGRTSKNRKTGPMLQTYILRADADPVSAARSGADASVCGDCKHRPALGGACYVTLMHGPASVYRGLRRGIYPDAATRDACAELGSGRRVRLGTYGDPAAVPVEVWEALTERSSGHTGYSHQWRNDALPADHRARLARLTMASVDDEIEAADARGKGMRYFRVRAPGEALQAREFICPASAEAGKRTTCAQCRACSGSRDADTRASPVIIAHGTRARRFIPIGVAHA